MGIKTIYVCDACAKEAAGEIDEQPDDWLSGVVTISFQSHGPPRVLPKGEGFPPRFSDADVIVCSTECAWARIKTLLTEAEAKK